MIEVKGYTTGEDFRLAEEGDLEEARTNSGVALSDVSIRTIVRYMTGIRKIDAAHWEQQPMPSGKVFDSAASEAASRDTLASENAQQALIKIAHATTVKLPSLTEKMPTVKQVLTFIKKYARAKKYAWETTGLYGAATAIRENAGFRTRMAPRV